MDHSFRNAAAGIAVLFAATACAATVKQELYVAPTNDTIRSETEQGRGDTPSHTIYVTNQSTVTIVVFGVALTSCENIKQRCEPQALNEVIGPGQRRVVLRVQPQVPTRGFNYRFSFSWRQQTPQAPPVPEAP